MPGATKPAFPKKAGFYYPHTKNKTAANCTKPNQSMMDLVLVQFAAAMRLLRINRYLTATVPCAVLLALFRSCVRAETVTLFVMCEPEAAIAFKLIFTPKLCPFSSRVLWQTTLPVVAPAAGTEHELAVLLEMLEKLKPAGMVSVRATASLPSGPRLLTVAVKPTIVPRGTSVALCVIVTFRSAAITTLAKKASLRPLSPGWKASGVTGKSASCVLPATQAFHAGSTKIRPPVVLLLPPSRVE